LRAQLGAAIKDRDQLDQLLKRAGFSRVSFKAFVEAMNPDQTVESLPNHERRAAGLGLTRSADAQALLAATKTNPGHSRGETRT
jgi:hypothetical protein